MEKKILIVDDDSFSRKILKNFLTKFPCVTFEAANGVEALALIATESPDLVLLDVNMPVLNGLDTLQEIRSSATHSRLPVVAVSAYAERSLVMKFIDLGIAGFLLKPLRPGVTVRRLETVFYALQRDPDHAITSGEEMGTTRPRLLLVERDPNFRQFAVPFLELHYEVIEAATGAVGWQAFEQQEPQVVLIGESLQLLAADRLVGLIRGTPHNTSRVYLMTDNASGEVNAPPEFDGVIRKSFIPEVFTRELNDTLFVDKSFSATIRSLIRSQLRAELITAAQQSIGVLASQETTLLDPTSAGEVSLAVQVRSELVSTEQNARVVVGWFASKEDAEQIAGKILGSPTLMETGAADAVSELVNTIAGRIRASLAAGGFHLEQQPPRFASNGPAALDPDCELAIPFRTADGELFLIAMWVHDGGIVELASPLEKDAGSAPEPDAVLDEPPAVLETETDAETAPEAQAVGA